jgi:hypothetical protein
MSTHPAHIFASVMLIGGAFVVGVTALAIALAKVLVDAGAAVRPADAALLGDMIPVLPFIVAFAATSLVAAIGLAVGGAWADTLAVGISIVAVVAGVTGLLLIVVGSDPFASTATAHSMSNGLGIVGAFTVAYAAVLVAVADARQPQQAALGAAA